MTIHPQLRAADPKISAFVAANAGSGKTKTLVERVARLLLHGARPEAILCVTYTKAAAAEMQRRLYQQLGGWSVTQDAELARRLISLGEEPHDLASARRLFARALETPGGLKIQTLHAFCEKLLRRFPLEAGVSPSFKVMEDAAASEVSASARDKLALYAAAHPDGVIAMAYAHFAVELDLGSFEGLLKTFESQRAEIENYLTHCGGLDGAVADVWRVCGFEEEAADPDTLEAEAVSACDWARWRDSAGHLLASGRSTDAALGQGMATSAEVEGGAFAEIWRLFSTEKGEPSKRLGTTGVASHVLDFLREEQARLHEICQRAKAARVARNTVYALSLAHAYATLYEAEKARRGALDFPDLIARTKRLLTERPDAAWVLYKLDGGIDHVLLDEAQDTSPEQWEILEALTADFFAGEGGRNGDFSRTLFAVGDEKQSIYSFQGADPEQLLIQTHAYNAKAAGSGRPFEVVPLIESWRSTPEVLSFVDEVFADPTTHPAVRPPAGEEVVTHVAVRGPGFGAVDLWPIFQDEPHEAPDAWDAPLDATPPETARKRLARRIAEEVRTIISRQAVVAKGDPARPEPRAATAGDVLILVRRRDALFEEIIRALKKAGLPVAGADRLKLSDHVVFQDILSLCRFCLYPADDLTVAELLRSPFCDVAEQGLYELAYGREGSLWSALGRRGGERTEWRDALTFLGWARGESQRQPPFDFLGRVLSRLDGQGRSMRQRILTRLGREAEDALDEMMAQTLSAEGRGIHDLERLTAALEHADIQVKRELDSENDAPHGGDVRVMTVHGAKGLEAPIVILPDTTGKPPPNRGALLKTDAGGFLFAPRKSDDCDASAEARAAIERRTAEEQLRLLYVALTRARDRVIVAGRLSSRDKTAPASSWYARIEEAFTRPKIAEGAREVEMQDLVIRRFGAEPGLIAASEQPAAQPRQTPNWLRAFAAAEAVQRYASPSTFADDHGGATPSPLAETSGLGRFRRGDIVHRLLQILPDLPSAARADGAARLLMKERDLTAEQRVEMAGAALDVLNDPRFAEVFGPDSRAEAAVAGSAPGLPPRLAVSGRVDRMVVTPKRVLVVDFKSNRPSPDTIDQADPAYLAQMAIYAAVLRAVFPGRTVEAALVWTDGPKLMPIPENLINATLATLVESD
jgi:ATP-dependent helicase/nuclease subunit A